MRTILFLIVTSIISGCESSNSEKHSLIEFQYPKDSLIHAKVFTFHRMDSLDIKMKVVHQVFEKNDSTLFVKYSLEKAGRDSSIFKEINSEFILHERYMVFPKGSEKISTTSKGKIIEWFDNYSRNKSVIEFEDVNNPDVSIRIEGSSTLDSTLVYNLKGKKINSIRYIEKTKISIAHKYHSSVKSSFEIEGESIFGKNIGMIYFKTKNNRTGKIESWELESIIDFKEYIKK